MRHLRLAQEACDALALSRVRLDSGGAAAAPGAAADPRRAPPGNDAAGDRAQSARFAVDDAEVRADRPSYTVPTLERLRRRPPARLPWCCCWAWMPSSPSTPGIAGASCSISPTSRWRTVPATRCGRRTWHRPLAAEFEARHRPDPLALRETAAGSVVQFEMTPLAISATAIRALLGAGRSARYLLPDPVLDYIDRNHLYSAALHGR
ncbi:MAG: hypothetical protein MZW92_64700 [Comamonadaceae bacterium]|nr:hypothetical protein [Comamonadaceae bacterium]